MTFSMISQIVSRRRFAAQLCASAATVACRASSAASGHFPIEHSDAEWRRLLTPEHYQILRQEGKLGTIAPGAYADLIVVDGDPLKKLELVLDQGAHLPVIMKAGKFHKNTLK